MIEINQTHYDDIILRCEDQDFGICPAEAQKLLQMLQRRAWVAVGVQLPEDEQPVLCLWHWDSYGKDKDHHSVGFYNPRNHSWWGLAPGNVIVTHWQPLPAGPEEGA